MENNYRLASHTTYRIGGPARYFSTCNSTDEIQEDIFFASKRNLPWFILGNGSNIIVSDEGFPGLVIKLGGNFKEVSFNEDTVEIGAGVLLPSLIKHFMPKGWGGFEFMCGIPGTIGGAARINAGTRQGEIKDNFISATILTPAGEIKTITKDAMNFSHRHSKLAETRDIVLSATFAKPYDSEKTSIDKKIKAIIKSRRDKQPKNHRNCGSVFKNPPGEKPVGWYIEQAGLKGAQIGGAMVAREHANWIVNLGSARSEHVKSLISMIQEEVFKRFGVSLEREIIYIPEDL